MAQAPLRVFPPTVHFHCDDSGCSSWFLLSVSLRVSRDKGLRRLTVITSTSLFNAPEGVDDGLSELECFLLFFVLFNLFTYTRFLPSPFSLEISNDNLLT